MPNFSFLACLKVAEKFVWDGVGGVGGHLKSPKLSLYLGGGDGSRKDHLVTL